MSPLVYKSRPVPSMKLGTERFFYTIYDSGNPGEFIEQIPATPFVGRDGTQTTGSEGHPWHSRNKGSLDDIGGDFFTTKTYLDVPSSQSATRNWTWYYRGADHYDATFQGPVYAVDPNRSGINFPPDLSSSDSGLDAIGAVAVSRCKPTNSVASLSVAFGELYKDHLPNVPGMKSWKAKLGFLKGLGDEFLNAAFGWTPLIHDVRSTAEAVRKSDVVMKQFLRDVGRPVRRDYEFPIEKSEADTLIATNIKPYFGPITSTLTSDYFGTVDVYRKRVTTRQRWFSGAFTYHLPDHIGEEVGKHAAKASKVFGIELTPDTLWNLTPWSWAVDWVSNTGDVVSNLSDKIQYGLVMKYGYVMETTITIDTYISVPHTKGPTNSGPHVETLPVQLVRITKKRRRANPFGFGLTWDGLNSVQLAILGALGITRGT